MGMLSNLGFQVATLRSGHTVRWLRGSSHQRHAMRRQLRRSVWLTLLSALLIAAAEGETIRGVVLEDHSGAPVPSAEVRVLRAGTREVVADLATDRDGRFQVALAAGEYGLEVAKRNYLSARVHLEVAGTAPSLAIPVPVRLIRCGVISGQVADQRGQAITGAYVFVMPKSSDSSDLRPFGSMRVDERGRYRLYNLPPGQYAVAVAYGASAMAFAADGVAHARSDTGSGVLYYPNNTNLQFLRISGGEEYEDIDFSVTPGALTSVGGRIDQTSARGRFWVALTPLAEPALAVALTQAEPDGNFHFEGVPAGAYSLLAAGPATARTAQGALLGSEPLFGRTSVDVSGQPIDGISLAVEGGRSAAFVLRAQHAEKGDACPHNAEIRLTSLEDWGVRLEYSAQIGEKAVNIGHLAPGRYRIDVVGLGDRCYSAASQTLDLTAEPDSRPVEVLVMPAGEIRGRLTGAVEATTFAVVLLRSGQDSNDALQVTLPNHDGRFAFAGLRPGRYRIAARPTSEDTKARWVPDVAFMVEIRVAGGAPTDLDLPAPRPPGKKPL